MKVWPDIKILGTVDVKHSHEVGKLVKHGTNNIPTSTVEMLIITLELDLNKTIAEIQMEKIQSGVTQQMRVLDGNIAILSWSQYQYQ